jgi:hypothetical protein
MVGEKFDDDLRSALIEWFLHEANPAELVLVKMVAAKHAKAVSKQ